MPRLEEFSCTKIFKQFLLINDKEKAIEILKLFSQLPNQPEFCQALQVYLTIKKEICDYCLQTLQWFHGLKHYKQAELDKIFPDIILELEYSTNIAEVSNIPLTLFSDILLPFE